ncbi:hypothetical protein NBRC10512_006784 [Rhodotorula toruloides]|uniref:RHTO0S12e01046g1_1 n=2 Tax=Rhodotorula toruloides TaxID=5286 RepID=A0A061BGN2_RHOTO|nr:DUF395 domain protein [Rhodotorula toruloides NP11]EMS23293.1 DUF395 domain protein [Rhodotorula toruloides NP11]CDR46155.1 RHTO0S12e01046g1_1 [Rhodotorula toruloides]
MPFTPTPALVGGLLLSFSTSSLALSHGRILGCSGIAHSSIAHLLELLGVTHTRSSAPPPKKDDRKDIPPSTSASAPWWKLASLAGFVAGGALLAILRPSIERLVGTALFDPPATIAQQGGLARVVLAGLLVGAGTKLANGCTSGHMLLGLSRFSRRSLAAVLTFFSFALLTSRLAPHPLAASFSLPVPLATSTATFSPAQTLALLALPPLASLATAHSDTLHSFFLSLTFTLGLSLAGMLRPSKVLSFFYLPLGPALKAPGTWDPSLAFVALGGLLPNALVYHGWMKKEDKPLVKGKEFTFPRDPRAGKIDARLVLGSALFGTGWGLIGLCPGPLLSLLGTGPTISGWTPWVFGGAFAMGGVGAGWVAL